MIIQYKDKETSIIYGINPIRLFITKDSKMVNLIDLLGTTLTDKATHNIFIKLEQYEIGKIITLKASIYNKKFAIYRIWDEKINKIEVPSAINHVNENKV